MSNLLIFILFWVERLLYLIINDVDDGRLLGYKVYYDAPIILHLLFADDIIFCKANQGQVMVVKELLL